MEHNLKFMLLSRINIPNIIWTIMSCNDDVSQDDKLACSACIVCIVCKCMLFIRIQRSPSYLVVDLLGFTSSLRIVTTFELVVTTIHFTSIALDDVV